MTDRRIPGTPLVALVATALLAACSGGTGDVGNGVLPSVSPSGPAVVYVAVGASESVGIGAQDPGSQAWTQVFYRTALPRAAVFVNLGIPGATVEQALGEEVPRAIAAHPNIVTVWLNVNDLIGGVPAATYGTELRSLLARLRSTGARVLVANTPPLDHLPLYVGCQPYVPAPGGTCDTSRTLHPDRLVGLVDAYNREIAGAVAAEDATLVDLHALGLAAERAGTETGLVSGDGFHPSTAGHRAVAAAFVAAYQRTVAPAP